MPGSTLNEEIMRASIQVTPRMQRWLLFTGGLAILIAGLAVAWAWFGTREIDRELLFFMGLKKRPFEGKPTARSLGEPVLDCVLREVDGNEVHLRDFVGKMPVVVEFGSFT